MSAKQTKTILVGIIVFLSILIVLQSCEKSDSGKLPITVAVSENEKKVFNYQDQTITVSATNFRESRCPINADCAWQGFASVKVIFTDDANEQEIYLCTGGCEVMSIPLVKTVTLNGTEFKIKLDEISPYPNLSDTQKPTPKVKFTLSL
ncbi:MAG: hypothetical protein EOO90_00685 [Pedobacter sp.]|nr:MAG: hypothetical protein EOO90_00685 [Pedobacter sp.]